MFSQVAQKVTRYLGYFWKKICHLKLLKIAQSGHTASYLLFTKEKRLMSVAFQPVALAML